MLTRDEVLRAVLLLQRHTLDGTAHNSELAIRLGVKGPSVTRRLQNLAEAGLVRYVWGHGASLTDEGLRLAAASVSQIQLIERFLHEVLHVPTENATEEAKLIARYVGERVMVGIVEYFGGRVVVETGAANKSPESDWALE